MKIVYYLITFLCLCPQLEAQTPTKNYTRIRTMRNVTGDEYIDLIQYYDGLGRPQLQMQKNGAGIGSHLLTLQEYDVCGRVWKNWLPAVSTSNYLNPDQLKSQVQQYYNDTLAFTRQNYQTTPADRVTYTTGPGQDWRGKGVKRDYLFNESSVSSPLACKKYSVNDGDGRAVTLDGYYNDNTLSVERVTDEDGHVTYTFTNSAEQVLLVRQMEGDTPYDTYSVYDSFGRLCTVLTPMYQESNNLSLHAYQYRYDGLGRCTEKTIPGCQPAKYRYDSADNLSWSEDGNLRSQYSSMSYSYDAFGRSIGTVWNEGTQPGQPIVSKYLTRNHYDNYDFLNSAEFFEVKPMLVYQEMPGYPTQYIDSITPASSAHGKLTCTETLMLDANQTLSGIFDRIFEALYYDKYDNLIQRRANNQVGGSEADYYAYSFTGKLLKHKHVHTAYGKATQTENYAYVYDHWERVSKVIFQLNDYPVITLMENTYDELGRLTAKKYHGSGTSSSNYVENTGYAYNIRGWLTNITGGKFTQTLQYTSGPGVPCYNGNISSMSWKSGDETAIRGYKFTYDNLNRLKKAAYGEGNNLSTNSDRFNEEVNSYDKLGNILGLKRYGQTSATGYGLIDNLSLTYSGNHLKKVTDGATSSVYGNGFEFKDGANQDTEYMYDNNGNLTKDLNKKITNIKYNCLNLPGRIEFEDGSSISYVYDANGTKLRTTHIIGNETTVTDYCGNVIYENETQVKLLTEAGYVSLNDNKHHYYLQDHQGNNRVVMNQDGIVEETNHYYPFGGLMSSSSNSVQPFKYNGKELDRKNGLDWYDYGARMYDAAIGRWHVVDPSSEKYYNWSPYGYCKSNPILRIDLDGKDDYTINNAGRLFRTEIEGSTSDRLMSTNKKAEPIIVNNKDLLKEMYEMQQTGQKMESYTSTVGLEDAAAVFKFGADNTSIEWKLDIYDDKGSKTAIIGTSGQASSVFSDKQKELKVKGDKVVDLHSHPYNNYAADQDMKVLKINAGAIYHKDSKTLFFYNHKNSHINNEDDKINTSEELLDKLKEKFMR